MSEPQKETLAAMREHGGELIRMGGGFWTWRNCSQVKVGVPAWYCTVGTLRALEKKGMITLIQENRSFYTLARLTEAGKIAG